MRKQHEGVPHVVEQWCILACLVLPKWVDWCHISPHGNVLDGEKKRVVRQNLPSWFLFIFIAFSCKNFKASSYYIIFWLSPAKQILSCRLWPCKGLVKIIGCEVCTQWDASSGWASPPSLPVKQWVVCFICHLSWFIGSFFLPGCDGNICISSWESPTVL